MANFRPVITRRIWLILWKIGCINLRRHRAVTRKKQTSAMNGNDKYEVNSGTPNTIKPCQTYKSNNFDAFTLFFEIPSSGLFSFLTLRSVSRSVRSLQARVRFFPCSLCFLHFRFQLHIDGRMWLPSSFSMHIWLLQLPSICLALTKSCGMLFGLLFSRSPMYCIQECFFSSIHFFTRLSFDW